MNIKKTYFFILFSFICQTRCFAEKRTNQPTCEPKPDGKVLYLHNWSSYTPDSVLKKFTSATGIKVVYDVFDSIESMETKLMTGEKYDIVFPPLFPTLMRTIHFTIKHFMPLKKKWIPNWKNMDDPIMQHIPKPALSYGIPYAWGTNGIGYDAQAIRRIIPNAPLDSWAILFHPKWLKKLKGHGISLMDNGIEMLQSIMLYLGLNPASQDKKEWDKALKYFEKIRPWLQKFDSAHQIESLVNGQTILMQGYSTYINIARNQIARHQNAHQKKEIKYIIPKEGTISWIDMIAIPRNAQHPANAHIFINFILRPEIMAEISNQVYAANAVRKSKPFIHPKIANDTSIFPAQNTYERLYAETLYPQDLVRYITRMWTQIKAGYKVKWNTKA
jgi:putrescine transport system substrate-binding protein